MRVRTTTATRTVQSIVSPLLNSASLASVEDNMVTGTYIGCRHTAHASIANLMQQAETLPVHAPVHAILRLRGAVDAVSCLLSIHYGHKPTTGQSALNATGRNDKS